MLCLNPYANSPQYNSVAARLVTNPPNPYQHYCVEWLGEPPTAELHVYEERCNSIISKNDSPDISFRFSINPYRGCFHGCTYCYARPSHQYLDFGAGTDFERKIVVKINAAEKLACELSSKKWTGDTIVFSGNTDCYQPLEASYGITRKCLEVCERYQNSVGIITKGALIRRDVDVLRRLHDAAGVRVVMSIAFSDDAEARKFEPGAPRPSVRLRAMQELKESGIPVGVAVSPIIPGINDRQIAQILERAAKAGAEMAFMTLLRLPAQVKDVFFGELNRSFPTKVRKVESYIRDCRDGLIYDNAFGKRMVGVGPRWEAIEWLFEQQCRRLGLASGERWKVLEARKKNLRPQRTLSKQLGLFS